MLYYYNSFSIFFFSSGFFFLLSKSFLSFFFELNIFKYIKMFMIFDQVSMFFFSILFMILGSVLCFSSFYMGLKNFKKRFLSMVLIFVFSMVLLMLIPDFFFLLLGWDGLGVSSFLLMIFYMSSNSWFSGFKTFLMNRLGDSFLILFCLYLMFKKDFFLLGSDLKLFFFVSLLFMLGLFTKSAMFPFSSWLPAAMAAPTPVSSLVHSSTLVTAGIYLMIRKYFFLDFSTFFFFFGFWTLSIASLAASFEFDSKKIMAYSTLSQLGLLLLILSLGKLELCFFHLLSHASFKALLFMCCGILIYNFFHQQDLRFFSGAFWVSSVVKIMFLSCNFSLCGLLFFSGFYSKDGFMELFSLNKALFMNFFFLFLVCLTIFYSFRLMKSIFFKSFFSVNLCKKFWLMFSMFPLWILSLYLGFFLKKIYVFFSFNSSFYNFLFLLFFFFFFGLSVKDWIFNSKIMFYFWSMGFLFYKNSFIFTQKFSKLGFFTSIFLEKKIFLGKIFFLKEFFIFSSSKFNILQYSFKSYNFFFWLFSLAFVGLLIFL